MRYPDSDNSTRHRQLCPEDFERPAWARPEQDPDLYRRERPPEGAERYRVQLYACTMPFYQAVEALAERAGVTPCQAFAAWLDFCSNFLSQAKEKESHV